jgi:hypothetical protein
MRVNNNVITPQVNSNLNINSNNTYIKPEQNLIPKLNQPDNSDKTQKLMYQSDLLRQMQEDIIKKQKAKQAEKERDLLEEQKYKDYM